MINTYILAPNLSTAPPPDGPVDLGSILTDLKDLSALNRKSRISIANEDMLPIDQKLNFRETRANLLKFNPGVFANFLGMFGVSVDAGVTFEKSMSDIFHIQTLETTCFNATDEYVRESMKALPVQMYLEDSGHKATVYMITGMKIARGASIETNTGHNIGARCKIGIGHPGIPAEGGPDVEISRSQSAGIAFDSSSDFILAVRVRKIRYKGPNVIHSLHTKGATMMEDCDSTQQVEGLGLGDNPEPSDVGVAEEFVIVQDPNGHDGEEWIVPKNFRDTLDSYQSKS